MQTYPPPRNSWMLMVSTWVQKPDLFFSLCQPTSSVTGCGSFKRPMFSVIAFQCLGFRRVGPLSLLKAAEPETPLLNPEAKDTSCKSWKVRGRILLCAVPRSVAAQLVAWAPGVTRFGNKTFPHSSMPRWTRISYIASGPRVHWEATQRMGLCSHPITGAQVPWH